MKFMNELVLKGYVMESTSAVETGKCWYLPTSSWDLPPKQTWEDTCDI